MASTVSVRGHASSWCRRWELAALITRGDLQIWVVEKKRFTGIIQYFVLGRNIRQLNSIVISLVVFKLFAI